MPELPEVETVVGELQRGGLPGRRITGVQVLWNRTVHSPQGVHFSQTLRGKSVVQIYRRGKFIGVALTGGYWLFIHLRMTGRLHFSSRKACSEGHIRVALKLDDGRRLHFHDTRKFGRMYLVSDPHTVVGHLGTEPLERSLTVSRFYKMLSSRHRQLKPLLLDQHFLAGLGNIYVDEALWEARMHPQRQSNTLSRADASRLLTAIRKVLRKGIRHCGTSLGRGQSNFFSVGRRRGGNRENLRVFRRTGLPCYACGTQISRTIVGQRATHICAQCQQGSW